MKNMKRSGITFHQSVTVVVFVFALVLVLTAATGWTGLLVPENKAVRAPPTCK